jgi:hypothetical protein
MRGYFNHGLVDALRDADQRINECFGAMSEMADESWRGIALYKSHSSILDV